MKINKKKLVLRLKVLSLCAVVSVVGVGFLMGLPKITEFAQSSSLLNTDRLSFLGSHNLIPEVAGVSTKAPVIQIQDSGRVTAPNFSAEAVLAYDLDLNQVIYQKNIHQRLSPASTTKLLTALVAVDYFKPGDILTVYGEDLVGGSSMGLQVGEKLTFRSLLYGMLLNSGNDAAFTIASNYPGGLNSFVSSMNKKVLDLSLKNSHFENPAGFDGLTHFSSAYDLSQIASKVSQNPQIAKVVSTKETFVTSLDDSKEHYLKNLNKLLGEDGVLGIKTGFTEKSGENLVGLVMRNSHKVLTVVLASKDRFGETENLINWIYGNFIWKQV
ncbi:D-alanyl-D-alanine carboxypeptidase [Candidatus Daviesbacteria bacterium]|nr:D-alanyl-D-alanine carboxypeptidase [Candidatus Daviesbacteria bacterium]